MHEHGEPWDRFAVRCSTKSGVLEHLQISIRVPRREKRPLADGVGDADRLPGSVINEGDLRLLHQRRLAVFHFEFQLALAPASAALANVVKLRINNAIHRTFMIELLPESFDRLDS